MKKIIKYLIMILLTAVISREMAAQQPPEDFRGEFSEMVTMDNLDTLVINRRHGDWWFGVTGGANMSLSFSDLRIPRRPADPVDQNNVLINFPSGTGGGYFIGLNGSWLPPGSQWGATMNILFEKRNSYTETDAMNEPYQPPGDPEVDTTNFNNYQRAYEINSTFGYLTLSPAVRYNLPYRGLHLYGGLDIEILLNSVITQRYMLNNYSSINQDQNVVNQSPVSVRFGMHVGIGYDMFVADINHRIRVHFCPFFTMHGGTTVFEGYNSSRNSILGRIGLQVKFGPDEVQTAKRIFDPTYVEPPEYLASGYKEKPVEGPELKTEALVAEDLAYVPFRESDNIKINEVSVESGDTTKITNVEKPDTAETTTEVVTTEVATTETKKDTSEVVAEIPDKKEDRTSTLDPSKKITLTFNTRMSGRDKSKLDEVARYLNENPGASLRIIGHEAATGTFSENEQRAKDRASVVVKYLQSKGIARRRLLDMGEGSRRPIAPNDTAAGRRKNRRVEIRIVQ